MALPTRAGHLMLLSVVTLFLLIAPNFVDAGSWFSRRRSTQRGVAKPSGRFANVDTQNTCNLPTDQRYSDLFFTHEQIRSMAATRNVSEVFAIKEVKFSYEFPGICGGQSAGQEHTHTLKPTAQPSCPMMLIRQQRTCCKTIMSFTVPSSLVSVYDGAAYDVVHGTDSYQIVHEASCESPGSPCASNGRCVLQERIQWILVNKGGSESFVPVRVGNHCYCQHY